MEKLATRPLHNVALAALPLVAVLLVGAIVVNENQRWEAWGERLALHQQKLAEADYRRPPLAGEAQSGNAFDDYARAVALSEALHRDPAFEVQSLWLAPDSTLLEPDAEFRLVEWNRALAHVRLGVRRSQAEAPAVRDPGAPPARLEAMRQLSNAAMLASRRLRLLGDSHAALEVVLDATGMALDYARSPLYTDAMIAISQLNALLEQGLSADLLAGLDPGSQQVLVDALDQLDAALPTDFPVQLEQARNYEYADGWARGQPGGPLVHGLLLWEERKALDAGALHAGFPVPSPQPWIDLRIRVHTLRAAVQRSLGDGSSQPEPRIDGG